jgi:hypothetical protein
MSPSGVSVYLKRSFWAVIKKKSVNIPLNSRGKVGYVPATDPDE